MEKVNRLFFHAFFPKKKLCEKQVFHFQFSKPDPETQFSGGFI